MNAASVLIFIPEKVLTYTTNTNSSTVGGDTNQIVLKLAHVNSPLTYTSFWKW